MEFVKFPELETERLILRKISLADAQAIYNIFSDADVTRNMGEAPFNNIDQAKNLINFMNMLFDKNKAIRWGIIKKEDDTLIGTCGFNGWEINRGSRGEIAYDIGKLYWRRGYATEAVKEIIKFGFKTMGLFRIEAFTNVDAVPSKSLLTKLGFQQDGILRGYAFFHGQYWDQVCFSLLEKDVH
jgi:ribosomal-protein-alanine N-acetyltransferase